jgi:hypothetical protein
VILAEPVQTGLAVTGIALLALVGYVLYLVWVVLLTTWWDVRDWWRRRHR